MKGTRIERAAKEARLCAEHLVALRHVLDVSRGALPMSELAAVLRAEAAAWTVVATLEGDGKRKGHPK